MLLLVLVAVACCGFEFCCFVYCGVGVLFAVGQAIVVLLMLMVLGCLLFICGLLCGYCGYVSVCGLFAVWVLFAGLLVGLAFG